MSQLHDALKSLSPTDYSNVPIDNLADYLRETFAQAEIIVNSVPPPPGGAEFHDSARCRSDSNPPAKASDLANSTARLPTPPPPVDELRKSWGKPMKFSAKDNPLGIAVYKMAGNDRHGAWFARSGVHEGLGFTKFKRAMQGEFPSELAVKGGPGAGAVRGLSATRRLERREVDGIGRMEVYYLTASFPGPVAPRDFLTLLLTSDRCLSDASAVEEIKSQGANPIPRHYMIVSRPLTHPDAPPKDGLVRGQYESVELIREIPLSPPGNTSSGDLTNGASNERPAEGESELNPVEWIMITRSDPGGGIPRFMVERGTPSSVVADVSKFLDWACSQDEIPNEDADAEAQEEAQQEHVELDKERPHIAEANGKSTGTEPQQSRSLTEAHEPSGPAGDSILSAIAGVVETGIATYAPAAVQERLVGLSSAGQGHEEDQADHNDRSDTSSINSFQSAQWHDTLDGGQSAESTESLGSRPSSPDASGIVRQRSRATSGHDRELEKLEQKKRQMEEKMRQQRDKETKRLAELSEYEEKEKTKAKERHEKELKKQEDKYNKEIAKLEQRREKETKKVEDQRRKTEEKDVVTRTQRERDEWKEKAKVLEKENKILHEQVETLQQENMVLVRKVGSTPEGEKGLRSVKDDVSARSRAGSAASRRSRHDTDNGEKKLTGGQAGMDAI